MSESHRDRARRRIAGPGLAVAALLLSAGCVVTQRSVEEPYGAPVGAATLERIPSGEGGVAWLEAVLGPPDARRPADDPPGAEIWSWVSGVHERGSGSVLIVGGSTDLERRTVTEATVADGRVLETRQWRDQGPAGSLAPIRSAEVAGDDESALPGV